MTEKRTKCEGAYRTGNPCRRWATEGLSLCPEHGGIWCGICNSASIVWFGPYEHHELCRACIEQVLAHGRRVEQLIGSINERLVEEMKSQGFPEELQNYLFMHVEGLPGPFYDLEYQYKQWKRTPSEIALEMNAWR